MDRVKQLFLGALIGVMLAGCNLTAPEQQAFQATVPSDAVNAPVYTATPSGTETPLVTDTPSATSTETLTSTPSETPTPEFTPTPSDTPTITPTLPLFTLTPAVPQGLPPAFENQAASFSPTEGWTCGDFPCEDDIDGFMSRIRVPDGFTLSHVGRFPGQPMQITYGQDGRLYATILENGTRNGAVYAMNADGTTARYSGDLISPIGLAFQPGTDTLYVSARITPSQGGGIWEVLPDGTTTLVVNGLPCCFSVIDNQPNGMIFGEDGWLYVGVGSLTDHLEPVDPRYEAYATLDELEASILRINPHTGEISIFARGFRNPYDLALTSTGQVYATDNGLLAGPGDRLLRVESGGNYGFPYWRTRGCSECPPTDPNITISPDFLRFPDYTLPRGIVAYTGTQFPENMWDNLFVALWHNRPNSQRIVRIDPASVPADPSTPYEPQPFVTGLIRPVDVTVAPDGSLVIADFIYGHIWRVSYTG